MRAVIYYHIYNRANGSENLFRKPENYRYFLQQWEKYITPVAATLAYCLMPNHFHVLVKIKDENDLEEYFKIKYKKTNLTGFKNLSGLLSRQFSNLFNAYSKAYNKMYERNGSLFQRPFKSKEITSDEYLTNIIFYIHHNPVHHGFTTTLVAWPYSSYPALISGKPSNLQSKAVYDWFGGKEQFRIFHNQEIKELAKLEKALTKL